MKKILLLILLMSVFYTAKSQRQPYIPYRTNGLLSMPKDSSLAVGYMLIPTFTSPSLTGYADRWGTNFGVNITNSRLSLRGNGAWLEYPNLPEVQSLIASASRSLSVGNNGAITLSGTGGNTVNLLSLSRAPVATFANANTVSTSQGFYPYATSSASALNYPFNTNGGGIKMFPNGNTFSGYFEFWKETVATDALYFRTGLDANTANAWDIMMGRNYALTIHPRSSNYTASGNGSATTISIPHGLTGVTANSAVNVSPRNPASAGISYVTSDATNINIIYTVAPASGVQNLLYTISIRP